MWSPASIAHLLRELGGIASTAELRAHGLSAQDLRIAYSYGSLRRVRRGWYAHPRLATPLVYAWAWGGVLACHSALAFGTDLYRANARLDLPLHVSVAGNSSIPSRPLSARVTAPAILHWDLVNDASESREDARHDARAPRTLVVPPNIAAMQAAQCDRVREPSYGIALSRVRRPPSPGWLP